MNRRPVFVAAVSAAAALVASMLFRVGYRGVIFDSYHYLTLSSIVSTEGLWNLFSRVRMYGYPLFVAAATGFSDPAPQSAHAIVAAVQTALLLAAAFYATRVSERVLGIAKTFDGTFALTALNPILVIRATELLSDSLSATLVGVSLFASLPEGHPRRRAAAAFLAAGFSIAVRPANLAVLPALVILWVLRARIYREGRELAGSLALGALGVAAALAPQLHGNVKAWDDWSPLLVERLYNEQAHWGITILKYGTLVEPAALPDQDPRLIYRNPLRPDDVLTPEGFWQSRPLGYLATLALHGFAMVDQDLPFTYVMDPHPRYRWPLSLANYAFLFLSGVGLAVLLTRERGTPAFLYGAGAALFSLALVAIYLPVAVENRFSAPLYVLLPPAAVYAVRWLSERRSGTIVAVGIAGAGFVAACVQVSIFLARQAPFLARP